MKRLFLSAALALLCTGCASFSLKSFEFGFGPAGVTVNLAEISWLEQADTQQEEVK